MIRAIRHSMLIHALLMTVSVALRSGAEPLLSDPFKDIQHLKAGAKKTDWTKAEQYLILAPGDQLKTGIDAHAQILFDTSTWMEIGGKTQFTFVQETPKIRKLKLSSGFVRISAAPAPPGFEVDAGNAIILSQGGRFTVSSRSKSAITVEASSGTLTIQNPAGKTSSLTQGQALSIAGARPGPPSPVERFATTNQPEGWTILAPRGFKQEQGGLVWKREHESDITLEDQPIVVQTEERILAKIETVQWPVEQDPALSCADPDMSETPQPPSPLFTMHWERGGRFHRPFFLNECQVQDPTKRGFCQIIRDYGIGFDFNGKLSSNILHLKYAYTAAIAMPGKASKSVQKAIEKKFCTRPGPGIAAFRDMIDSLEPPPESKLRIRSPARQALPANQGNLPQRIQLPTYKP